MPVAGATLYGTQLILSKDGVTYYSICKSRTTATTKTKTEQGFRPEYLLYYSSGTTVSSGSRIASSTAHESVPFDVRYSINQTSVTAQKPIYLVCTRGVDGLYYLADTWWSQSLPTTEDGLYYIHVGYAYATTSMYLKPQREVYKYIGGAVRDVSYAEAYALLTEVENGSY